MNGLYYYKLVSEYPEDVTKNCKLTINEIDSNFKTLKDNDIKKAEFVRGEDTANKSDGTLILTRNNDEKIIIPIDITLDKNITYDLKTNVDEGRSGSTLTITYKDDEGIHTTTLENVITADNLVDVIGHDILTKVISDSSLRGLGTMSSPLGIAGIEKTGMLASAIKVLDLTDGGELPPLAKEKTRFVTKEYVNDYGYLYNGVGVEKIKEILDNQYERDEIYKEVEDRKYYWHVPSKSDWDVLLDSIEPCEYRNHKSAQCHIELGKYAGKFLKSECGWVNSEHECTCTGTRPYTGCTTSSSADDDDYISDDINPEPESNNIGPVGVDKYGMGILPSGVAIFKNNTPRVEGFKETSAFWTTTILAPGQDTYVKIFDYDKGGVYQVAECPSPYYSVRLVKDYDGSNYRDSEYINGVLYKAILFPESGQIWLATNFADKKGFITIQNREADETPEVLDPNNGVLPFEKRVEMFINEWNGRYWEKKVMEEGTTIVIQNPCFDNISGDTMEFCWTDTEGHENCITVEVPKVYQENTEYRVYLSDEGCDKVLKNTDDLVVERVLNVVVPLIDQERWEREKSDTILSGMIETEKEEREAADESLQELIESEIDRAKDVEGQLWNAINEEASARTEVDNQLWNAIAQEASARTEVDNQQWEAINAEASARTEVDNQLWNAIIQEASARTEVDNQQWNAIAQEASARTEVDNQQWTAINNEIARAKFEENRIEGEIIDNPNDPLNEETAQYVEEIDGTNYYILKVNGGVILKSKSGTNDIPLRLDADFGSF